MGTPYIGDFFLFTFSFSLFTFYFPTLSSSNKTTIFVLIGTNEFKYAPYLLLLLCRTPDLSGGGYSCIIHKTTNNTKAPPKWSFFVLSHVQFFSHRPSGNPGAAYCPAVAGRQHPSFRAAPSFQQEKRLAVRETGMDAVVRKCESAGGLRHFPRCPAKRPVGPGQNSARCHQRQYRHRLRAYWESHGNTRDPLPAGKRFGRKKGNTEIPGC